MINIALCENNDVCRRMMTNILEKIQYFRNFSISVPSPDSRFITQIKKSSPDIILMDENFRTHKTSGGPDTVKMLSGHYSKAEVIYLTSSPEYLKRRICGAERPEYILKPAEFDDVKRTVLSSITRIAPWEELSFRCSRSEILLNPNDIIYFEADKRNTNIRTKETSYVSSENISTIAQRLPKRSFFRTHRTYILNCRHIARTEADRIEMKNGEYILLSRHRRKQFEEFLTQYRS